MLYFVIITLDLAICSFMSLFWCHCGFQSGFFSCWSHYLILVWFNLAQFGSIWLSLPQFWLFWLTLAHFMFILAQLSSGKFSLAHFKIAGFSSVLLILAQFGSICWIWLSLNKFSLKNYVTICLSLTRLKVKYRTSC